jgi:hypothetical protein
MTATIDTKNNINRNICHYAAGACIMSTSNNECIQILTEKPQLKEENAWDTLTQMEG